MKPLVIYHKDCFDGITAAWIADRYFKMNPALIDWIPEFIPATYGDKPPNVKGKDVFILDFSYPYDVLVEVARASQSILVLDHHKTAQQDLQGLPYAIFDMNKSGAGMAWDWFFVGSPRPPLITVIEDRDLWRFSLPYTREAMAWIATVPHDLKSWDDLMGDSLEKIIERGKSIMKYIEAYGIKAREHRRVETIAGFQVPTMNIPYMNCSEHLHALMNYYDRLMLTYDFVASYFLRGDNKWQFSLRSRGDFDVSEIAKQFGGGGHRNSAGFTVDTLPWKSS